jgi:3-deoxy-manno-octulosonate cytidylyltransferase (CMP-KDO synthetase)
VPILGLDFDWQRDTLNGVPFASPHGPDGGRPSTLAVIPARLGATRLPRKPLRLLGGAPLIVRVWERVVDSAAADRVIVATDSDEIAAVVQERGGEVAMTRVDHPSGTDRVAEVAERPECLAFDIIVNVQGDEPFVRAEAIAGAAALVRSGRFPLGTCATRASADAVDNPDVVKVVCGDDGRALYFSRAPIPFLRDRSDANLLKAHVRQHLGLYAYSRSALRRWVSLPVHDLERIERLEQLRPLAAGMAMGVHVVDAPPLGGVDTEEDLARANALWDDLFAGRP